MVTLWLIKETRALETGEVIKEDPDVALELAAF